jgi:peptide/nickel transport system ATP-binding protein
MKMTTRRETAYAGTNLLKVANLVAGLRNGAHIVDDVSFEIAAGETFALLGESGCGKSMTALSLMRLLPDGVVNAGGVARMEDVALFDLSEHDMREMRGGRMAMIFQEPGLSLNPVMTVGEQIAEVLALHQRAPSPQPSPIKGEGVDSLPTRGGGVGITSDLAALPPSRMASSSIRGGNQKGQRCIELLDQVGIPDAARRIHEYPFQLSGGMKQRVMIAMALAGNPKLLIADEPTTALDVTIQAQVLQLLRDTQDETDMAMLLITHDLGVVAENAHRVGVMYAGQIVEQASREQLFSQPLHPYTQKLLAALPNATRAGEVLSAIPGSVPPLGSITMGCRFTARCDRAWALCSERTPEWTVVEGQGVRCHLYEGQGARIEDRGLRTEFPSPASGRGGRGEGVSVLGTQSSTLLQVSDLQVHFPIRKGLLQRVVGNVKAVDGVSLDIPKGRTLALVGESGCGKTTLGKALLGLVPVTAGSVCFGNDETSSDCASGAGKFSAKHGRILRSHSMQMVFQDPYASLNPKMRVAEILEEGMSALNIGGDSAARQAHIDGLLDKVGLARDSKWRYPHEFSGGQRQRIAIARALAVSPQLLICDEPTSALDVSVQAQILNLLKSLQQELGLSYLFITHNLAVVEYLAHEVCVMYLGRIVERGTTAEVMRAPKHPYTQALLSAVPRIDGKGRAFIKLEGDMPSPANPPQGCHFAPRCRHVMPVCASYPAKTNISATHDVCCHLYSGKNPPAPTAALP